ncbi:hypothetical protein ACFE04_025499 [Oxalis oulophora]
MESHNNNTMFYNFLDRMRNPASLDLGMEKYVMTKLFARTFAATPEDIKFDHEISEKIQLLQTFLRPEHLDIPTILQNEASWLLAEKELQKINSFKAPREKLLCIMNCCRVINNLLLNASISENRVMAGADDFLPANPPQLHSNLRYIQLFRRQSKLVSEAAYYFTNLISAKSFIVDLNAKSLSIEEIEFEESMQAAKLANKVTEVETLNEKETLGIPTDPGPSARTNNEESLIGGSDYPFMHAEAGELTVDEVSKLLSIYKEVVLKYTSLAKTVQLLSMSKSTIPPNITLTENEAISSRSKKDDAEDK